MEKFLKICKGCASSTLQDPKDLRYDTAKMPQIIKCLSKPQTQNTNTITLLRYLLVVYQIHYR